MNKATREMFPGARVGLTCHGVFFDRSEPCPGCPLDEVRMHRKEISSPVHFVKSEKWFRINYQYASIDERDCCVCVGTGITSFKSSLIMTRRIANRALQDLLAEVVLPKKCYEVLWDRTVPCEHCPMSSLKVDETHNYEVYNPKLGRLLSLDCTLLKTLQNEELAVFTGHDVTHRLEYESRLKKLAFSDSMLEIGNQAGFHRNVEQAINDGEVAYVCVVSVKNFNNVNMLFGRERGNFILKSFATSFSSEVPDGRVYRVGGCKFAFTVESQELGEKVIDKVWHQVCRSLSPEEKNFHIPLDCVFIEFPRFALSSESLLINAEYKLKSNNGSDSGKRMIFDEQDRIAMERRSLLTSVISNAMENERFKVFYQPIYSYEKQGFTKAEALLRLFDEQLGWVAPDEFIPIAEEQGLIHDLGLYVLEHVCRKLAERQSKGFFPVGIHINVSTIQFSRNGFFDSFMDIILRYRIDPSQIVIEVTESIMIQSFDYIMSIMKKFISRGVFFSLDDFGTGYSSLNYIAALPITSIKLDKSFVDRAENSDVYRLLIKNVVEIARGLQLELIVEGVETLEQANALKCLGCQSMQGYYFARPLSESGLDKIFSQRESVYPVLATSGAC